MSNASQSAGPAAATAAAAAAASMADRWTRVRVAGTQGPLVRPTPSPGDGAQNMQIRTCVPITFNEGGTACLRHGAPTRFGERIQTSFSKQALRQQAPSDCGPHNVLPVLQLACRMHVQDTHGTTVLGKHTHVQLHATNLLIWPPTHRPGGSAACLPHGP